jgi:hypothetical protein
MRERSECCIDIMKGSHFKPLNLFNFILNLWFEKSIDIYKYIKNIDYLNDGSLMKVT